MLTLSNTLFIAELAFFAARHAKCTDNPVGTDNEQIRAQALPSIPGPAKLLQGIRRNMEPRNMKQSELVSNDRMPWDNSKHSRVIFQDYFFNTPYFKTAQVRNVENFQSCELFCTNVQQVDNAIFMSYGGTTGVNARICNCYSQVPIDNPVYQPRSNTVSFVIRTSGYAWPSARPDAKFWSADAAACQSHCLLVAWMSCRKNAIFMFTSNYKKTQHCDDEHEMCKDCDDMRPMPPQGNIPIPRVSDNCSCFFYTPRQKVVCSNASTFGLAMDPIVQSVVEDSEPDRRRLAATPAEKKGNEPLFKLEPHTEVMRITLEKWCRGTCTRPLCAHDPMCMASCFNLCGIKPNPSEIGEGMNTKATDSQEHSKSKTDGRPQNTDTDDSQDADIQLVQSMAPETKMQHNNLVNSLRCMSCNFKESREDTLYPFHCHGCS